MGNTKEYGIEGITLSMGLVDAIPVLFFIAGSIVISLMFNSVLFAIGAGLCSLAGATKVSWKLILAGLKKNIFILNRAFRYLMPAGFLLIIISLIIDRNFLSMSSIIGGLTGFPQVIFFVIGIIGMIIMTILAKKLDSSDAKSNWIEQITNSVAQGCFFLGLLIIYL